MSGACGGPPDPRGGGETVLLVDDNEQVRTLVRMLLERAGFSVLEAVDGHEALAVVDARPEPIDLLVTDMSMPGMSGRELADVVRSRRATTRVLFTSGFADPRAQRADSEHEDYLMKPFTNDQLVATARALLGQPPMSDDTA